GVGGALRPAGRRGSGAEAAMRAIGPSIPAFLRTKPAPWALWFWLLRVLYGLVRWSLWRAFAAAARERDDAQGEVMVLRKLGTKAAEACREAETQMAPTAAHVEQGRRALGALRSEIATIETRIERSTRMEAELAEHREKRLARFSADVSVLTGAASLGRPVIELEIDYPARLLPEDVVVIDTPGVTDESDRAHERGWSVLREEADGCILISEL